ncbi:conserved hypothetical protein [Frankia sp. AgKG'84/4]
MDGPAGPAGSGTRDDPGRRRYLGRGEHPTALGGRVQGQHTVAPHRAHVVAGAQQIRTPRRRLARGGHHPTHGGLAQDGLDRHRAPQPADARVDNRAATVPPGVIGERLGGAVRERRRPDPLRADGHPDRAGERRAQVIRPHQGLRSGRTQAGRGEVTGEEGDPTPRQRVAPGRRQREGQRDVRAADVDEVRTGHRLRRQLQRLDQVLDEPVGVTQRRAAGIDSDDQRSILIAHLDPFDDATPDAAARCAERRLAASGGVSGQQICTSQL